jgi:hypothetical protein
LTPEWPTKHFPEEKTGLFRAVWFEDLPLPQDSVRGRGLAKSRIHSDPLPNASRDFTFSTVVEREMVLFERLFDEIEKNP